MRGDCARGIRQGKMYLGVVERKEHRGQARRQRQHHRDGEGVREGARKGTRGVGVLGFITV